MMESALAAPSKKEIPFDFMYLDAQRFEASRPRSQAEEMKLAHSSMEQFVLAHGKWLLAQGDFNHRHAHWELVGILAPEK